VVVVVVVVLVLVLVLVVVVVVVVVAGVRVLLIKALTVRCGVIHYYRLLCLNPDPNPNPIIIYVENNRFIEAENLV
jgi:hypothetical protein